MFKYTFEETDFKTVFDSNIFRNLLIQNWIDTGPFGDMPLNPDWDTYRAVWQTGALRIYLARQDQTELIVGYAVFFVRHHPHYKDTKQATSDMIFISPAHRGFGKKFIAWIDEQLKNEGVSAVYRHVTFKNRFGVLLERMGYEALETTYVKRLDKSGDEWAQGQKLHSSPQP